VSCSRDLHGLDTKWLQSVLATKERVQRKGYYTLLTVKSSFKKAHFSVNRFPYRQSTLSDTELTLGGSEPWGGRHRRKRRNKSRRRGVARWIHDRIWEREGGKRRRERMRRKEKIE
jgi:hypothetical protein